MPRLDWQLWFAATEKFEDNLWLQNFAIRLLEGSPNVYELIKKDPFHREIPKHLRFVKRQLNLISASELFSTNGKWWTRGEEYIFGPLFHRDQKDPEEFN
jgi:hypothetical protein